MAVYERSLELETKSCSTKKSVSPLNGATRGCVNREPSDEDEERKSDVRS